MHGPEHTHGIEQPGRCVRDRRDLHALMEVQQRELQEHEAVLPPVPGLERALLELEHIAVEPFGAAQVSLVVQHEGEHAPADGDVPARFTEKPKALVNRLAQQPFGLVV